MKLANKGVFLNIIILSVLILSGLSIAPKTTDKSIFGPLEVCAADVVNPTDTGLACIRKSGDCPNGFSTLVEALSSNLFVLNGNNISKGALQTALVKSYGSEGLYNTCISEDYNRTITIFTSPITDGTQAGVPKNQGLDLDVLTGGGRDVARLCNPNTFPDAADASVGPGKPNPGWGCCPSNYNYVTAFNIADLNESQGFKNIGSQRNAGCCPLTGGVEAQYWSPVGSDNNHCMIDSEYKVPLQGGAGTLTEYPNDTTAFSIYGQPMGKSVVGGAYIQASTPNPNKFVCPEGSACVADPANNLYNSSIGPDGKEKGLSACSAEAIVGDTTTNTSKAKCYADGEFIGTIDANGQKLVRKCDITSATFYVDVVACNNSLSDELACRGSGASQTNYDLCCKCRIAGGVWTGIGCTDTTPLGIITGIIRIVFGVVGGIALIQLIIAGIMYQTGDEARIKEARESIIKTLTGLAVLVFSILILRIIGINILDVLPVGSV